MKAHCSNYRNNSSYITKKKSIFYKRKKLEGKTISVLKFKGKKVKTVDCIFAVSSRAAGF